MTYQFKDVWEVQEKYPTKEEREKMLETLSDAELWHIAKTCSTPQGGAYYASFMKDPDKYRTKKEW